MKVWLNKITGIDDAMVSMFMSKHSWTRDLENHIRMVCHNVLEYDGSLRNDEYLDKEQYEEFTRLMDKLVGWGWKHITMLRFIDFSITVEGLHRAGQDDWDAHAQRYNNRIIRNSTRVNESDSHFSTDVSEWYQDKIIPTDVALGILGISTPDTIEYGGKTYVRRTNGYIVDEYADSPDAKRGLYMLSIPSSFIFKVNLTEWSHVYKERNAKGHANPEVKMLCETIADLVQQSHKQFDRELFMKVLN